MKQYYILQLKEKILILSNFCFQIKILTLILYILQKLILIFLNNKKRVIYCTDICYIITITNFYKIRFRFFNKTPLYMAIEKENLEIVNLLLENKKINVNIINIFLKKLNEICQILVY